ncbi:MAG: hypothetical protein ACFCD0_14105 [Gemmataceae bacterium]
MCQNRFLVIAGSILALALGATAISALWSPVSIGNAQVNAGKKQNVRANPTKNVGVGNPDGPAPSLPVTHATLYTSGVGYFQREKEIDGNTNVELSFSVADINDLLKSLVLRDLGDGQVQMVGYDSQDPISKALKGYVVDLSSNPSYAQILNQTRGERIEVNWFPGDAKVSTTTIGKIVGIETKTQVTKDRLTTSSEYLNLWTEEGMQSIKLTEINKVRFVNALINDEVSKALDVVARGHDVAQKSVRFHFSGKGRRRVQIGYVVEHPVWKTTYRLVLGEKGEPYLQGWAIIENPTNEDWNDVQVRLISGRPVSFRMDLYQPLYADRPQVQLPRLAGLVPKIYESTFERVSNELDDAQQQMADLGLDRAKRSSPREAREKLSKKAKGLPPAFGGKLEAVERLESLRKSVVSAAQARQLGDQFQYVVKDPVSLPRQKSAMVPIVTSDIQGQRVSIYNENNLDKHPMRGLRLTNSTELHLMQGPVTVYDQGSYAGDALINDLQPKEKRLLSYAVDLATEVKPEAKDHPRNVLQIYVVKGIVHKKILQRETKVYHIKNRGQEDRLVIVEHSDRSPTYKLVEPKKPSEKSRSHYRFDVDVPAGKTMAFEVVEERDVDEVIYLSNASTDQIQLLIKNTLTSEQLKKALQKAIVVKNAIAQTQTKISRLREKLSTIERDQERQRKNMAVIPQTEKIYKKYLDKFLKQEDQIVEYRDQIEELQKALDQQQRDYGDYIQNLTIRQNKD